MTSESDQKSPFEAAIAYETRLWIGVIATLLMAEVWMHVFGHRTSSPWGLIPAGVLFGVTVVAFRYYSRVKHISWIIITVALGVIGVSVATEAVGLALLGDVDLTDFTDPDGATTRLLGRVGPSHGLLAVGHVLSDFSVLGIGVYQLVRWFRLRRFRNTRVALTGIASFGACCGTTAVVLFPIFSGVLGAFGIHAGGFSYLMLGTLLSVGLVAIAFVYAWSGGLRLSRAWAKG